MEWNSEVPLFAASRNRNKNGGWRERGKKRNGKERKGRDRSSRNQFPFVNTGTGVSCVLSFYFCFSAERDFHVVERPPVDS